MRYRALFPFLPATLLLSLAAIPASSATLLAPGVPNFHQVSDTVFRGGQPDAEGWQSLAKLGVTTVLDLCDEHSAAVEQRAVEGAGMKYVSLPMNGNGMGAPSEKLIAEALSVLTQPGGVVFVHCHKGSDRTGTVVACYRIEYQQWTPAKALKEAESYGMSWINVGMKHYISNYRTAMAGSAPAAAAAVVVGGPR